jgi:CheY-like chemotaxis protein
MTYKVLIVDDSKLARMSIARTLTALQPDWIRLEAATADEAILRLTEERADIALLDFNMPGRDGLELAAQLQGLDPDMPLAVVSANIQDEVVARAREVGAAFLSKPLTEQALADFFSGAQLRLRAMGR